MAKRDMCNCAVVLASAAIAPQNC